MEFALGYLFGSGANWPTILATILLLIVLGVIAKAILGDH